MNQGMMWLLNFWKWIRRDWKRFAWEVVAAVFLSVVGWGISELLTSQKLAGCQDERAVLLKQSTRNQAILDSIVYEGLLAIKKLEISEKDAQILDLKQKIASDSIQHLTDLQAVRTINQYIRAGKSGRK
jgi:hypothetical protein